ncbi:MAG: hypothetical protein GC192_15205 [Bacteroidetes bacterium]|nr:hypothetical protein [Bacteroidota bacterium]
MKPILRFATRYLLLFLVLFISLNGISLIPKVGAICNQIYLKPTESILKTMLPKAYLQLKPSPESPDVIRIEYASKKQVDEQVNAARTAKQATTPINGMELTIKFYNTFLVLYIFLITLTLISPVSWKDKAYNLIIGSVLFYLYKTLKLYLLCLVTFAHPNIGIYHLSDFWYKAFQAILSFLAVGTDMVVVLVLWAMLTFRNKKWGELLKPKG